MSRDLEDLLRNELRGAAAGAPQHLGVDDQDVLTRGRRVVVRRRLLTAAGAAAATLAVAGTIGVLAPRAGDDALPALPTPTMSATPDPTPTITSSASATVTTTPSVSATPTATASSTPKSSATGSARTPSSTPSRTTAPAAPPTTPTPSPTPPVATSWSEPASLGGVRYRTRLVNPRLEGDYRIVEVDVEADGQVIFTKRGQDYGEWGTRGLAPNVLLLYNVGPLQDVVSENGVPVEGEEFHTFEMPFPGTDTTVTYTIVSLPRPVTRDANGFLKSFMVKHADGRTYGLGITDPEF